MVPVELGSSYTEEDWGMKLVPFEEFVNDFILKKSQSVGYLAQHQLFDQVINCTDYLHEVHPELEESDKVFDNFHL